MLEHFDIKLLSEKDGSWEAFKSDWIEQCEKVGEQYDEYSPDALSTIEGIACRTLRVPDGTSQSAIGALWDGDARHYYAACVLNRTMLPSTPGYTLRVRQLIVSPLIDYGVAEVQMYPDVVIGLTLGIVHLSSSVLPANSIHFHLRSPEDMSYFRAFGAALGSRRVFASVQPRGSWLYIEKATAVGTAVTEEAQ